MRAARLVGLSPDGRYVIVATDRGEELAIAADDRLRGALRGLPAASEKLEIEMESALNPREIQTRIRSGESVDDVARVAGIDHDRVERFAAPVIAEREHVAGLAMTSSARRRGEASSHRTLRGVLNERLLNRGVDIGTVSWDSYRLDDGRWAVTADYLSGETPRQALFYFDLPGRFSVAGNDEGRWVLGDVSPSRGPQPGRQPPAPGEHEADTEPTLDLSDELALVRVIQDIPMAPSVYPTAESGQPVGVTEIEGRDVEVAQVVQLSAVRDEPAVDEPPPDGPGGLDVLDQMMSDQDVQGSSAPSDASAVPELELPLRSDGWEPAIVVDYPVEPSEDADAVDTDVEISEASDDPGRPEPPVAEQDRRDEAAALEREPAITEPEEQSLPLDLPEQPAPTPPKPARRKRASVPSWDEIVFGGPKET